MPENKRFNRKSPRLKDYAYSQDGAYFVTICSHERQHLFGHVDNDGVMPLNEWGQIAKACWQEVPRHFPHVGLDQFVIMPNHMHRILFLIGYENISESPKSNTDVGSIHESSLQENNIPHGSKPGSVSAIIGLYKSTGTKPINQLRNENTFAIWQRSFHDHIIRNETVLSKLRQYIQYNPQLWAEDRYYSHVI